MELGTSEVNCFIETQNLIKSSTIYRVEHRITCSLKSAFCMKSSQCLSITYPIKIDLEEILQRLDDATQW